MYACPIEFILPSLSVGVGKTIEKAGWWQHIIITPELAIKIIFD